LSLKADLLKKIDNSTAHRKPREILANHVIQNKELLPLLVKTALNPEIESHYKACWILEIIFEKHTEWIVDYYTIIKERMGDISHDGALRSLTKIAMFISENKKNQPDEEIELAYIEQCFLWLKNLDKVASKVYAMYALKNFSKKHQWIKNELVFIIEKDFNSFSSAYQAAAKMVLKALANA